MEGLNVVSVGIEPITPIPPAPAPAPASDPALPTAWTAAIKGVFSIIGVCGESKGRMPTNDDSSQHFLEEKKKKKTGEEIKKGNEKKKT